MEQQKITLIYDREGTNEIYYEDMENFSKSLYKNVYNSAFKQVEGIINSQSEPRVDGGNQSRRQNQVDNLICFVGDRGSGKTSAMLSFMEALKDYYYKDKENIFYKFKSENNRSRQNISFLGLNYIDASLLENGEDLIETILIMMYDKLNSLQREDFLRKNNFEYDQRELLRRFERVIAGIRNLKKGHREHEEYDTYIGILKTMSVSMSLKEEFALLVKDYLQLIQFKKEPKAYNGWENSNKPYLIITIDDIDLNLESGFYMLEQIHRYLMVPQVIVLLALDDRQMIRVCEKHFWELYHNNQNVNRANEWEQQVENIAQKYFNKVIPIYRRIYLPRIPDYENLLFIKEKQGESEIGLKKFLLYKIAQKTGVCFDICGFKRHFYEPMTIREGVAFCQFTDSLECIEEIDHTDQTEWLSKIEHNYRLLSSDIYRRMVGEELTGQYYSAFHLIRNEGVMTRSNAAFRNLYNMMSDNNRKITGQTNLEIYNYGKLLKVIYEFGRVKPENKALVRCLLASLSVSYTKQYYQMKFNEEEKEEAKRILRRLLGTSIADTWADQMLPDFSSTYSEIGQKRIIRIGRFSRVSMTGITIWRMPEAKDFATFIEEENGVKWLTGLELILMFYHNYEDELGNKCACPLKILGEQITVVSSEDEKKLENDKAYSGINPDKKITISGKACFELLGFVRALFDYERFFDEIHKTIKDVLIQHYSLKEEETESLNDFIRENSLRKKYEKWFKDYMGMALPFYNIDMTYNVLKRSMHAFQSIAEQTVDIKTVVDKVQEMYIRIETELEKEDIGYKNIDSVFQIAEWKKAFSESPFILEFRKRLDDSGFRKQFQNLIQEMSNRAVENSVGLNLDLLTTEESVGK